MLTSELTDSGRTVSRGGKADGIHHVLDDRGQEEVQSFLGLRQQSRLLGEEGVRAAFVPPELVCSQRSPAGSAQRPRTTLGDTSGKAQGAEAAYEAVHSQPLSDQAKAVGTGRCSLAQQRAPVEGVWCGPRGGLAVV